MLYTNTHTYTHTGTHTQIEYNVKRGMCKKIEMCAVVFSRCSRSLYNAAGCAYLLLWSVEHEEPKMSWKGINPISSSLYRPHFPTPRSSFVLLSAHPGPVFASLLQVLAPSMRLVRQSSCRGSAVYWMGPRGPLSKEDRRAGVWPSYDDITSFQEAAARVRAPFTIPTNIFMIIKNIFIYHRLFEPVNGTK